MQSEHRRKLFRKGGDINAMSSIITVCIPCLNEESTIAKAIADWHSALPEAEITVYDNGSDDRTAEEAARAGAGVKMCRVRGKGNVIRQMFEEETASCLIIVDGDDTYGTECARLMADDILKRGFDMSIGTRNEFFDSELSATHDFGNRLVRWLVNRLCRTHYSDVMSGCRAFSRQFRIAFPAESRGFETETEMNIYAGMTGMKVSEHRLSYRNRKTGSKVRTFSDGMKIIFFILKRATGSAQLTKRKDDVA